MRNGIGSHQSAVMGKDEWLTPPFILKKLGVFDLDPCAPKVRPWDMANNHFSIDQNGLELQWFGRIWCNPPYGAQTHTWLNKMANHSNGIALVFARTETKMFFDEVWDKAHGCLFLKGRLHFHHNSGERANANAGAPSVLIAYGAENAECLKHCGLPGKYIQLIQ